MLRGMTVAQFFEWIAYAEMEPFDEIRADYRAASIVAMIANMNRDIKKHPRALPIADFVLKFGVETTRPKRQTWQEQKLVAAQFAAMYADK
jgi:hypothetical protein